MQKRLWSLYTRNPEHAHQPVVGTVPGLPEVPIQYFSAFHLSVELLYFFFFFSLSLSLSL